MALRVLLADESSTIKKVMQLALADFAVEVKSVPVGLDVLPVTKSFRPDIVFADVLLTKRSGYEVCADLKEDSETRQIPVVLMWSGFMEIDEGRIVQCGANGRLEKPFDAEHLRNLVSSLVQKTETNPVSSFLNFPNMPEIEERPADNRATLTEEELYAIPEEDSGVHTQTSIPDEEFAAVPLTMPKDLEDQEDGEWAHQDLNKFKIQIPPENESDDFAAKFVIPQNEMDDVLVETTGDFEEISFDKNEAPAMKSVKDKMIETLTQTQSRPNVAAQAPARSATQPKTQQKMDINADMVEKVLREEAREVLESICWKILPEIAERVVREEINKILRDAEKNI
jgi:CheY-like chemotaxis protein